MKNIHILPTNRPSRLIMDATGDKIYLLFYTTKKSTNVFPQTIYITSDEEIKKGDWKLDTFHNQTSKVTNINSISKYDKKIILTKNQDLIQDGVQEIEDEFLEWFVENPTCEHVYFEREHDDTVPYPKMRYVKPYKIIIPKEEPKQDLEKEMFELEQELDIPSHLRWHNSKPKQETLEYDLLQQIKFCLECKNDSQAIRLIEKYGFEKQEKCEKDLDAHLDVAEHLWLQAVKKNKKMYSYEEVIELNLRYLQELGKQQSENGHWINFKKWFEKFKNK